MTATMDGEPQPYNSDPMDQRPKEWKKGDDIRWGFETERSVLTEMLPILDWNQIQADAAVETEKRFIDFSVSKNFRGVDRLLDNPFEILPDDLMEKTWGYNKFNHPRDVMTEEEVHRDVEER